MNLLKDSLQFNNKKNHLLLMPVPINILLLDDSGKHEKLMTD